MNIWLLAPLIYWCQLLFSKQFVFLYQFFYSIEIPGQYSDSSLKLRLPLSNLSETSALERAFEKGSLGGFDVRLHLFMVKINVSECCYIPVRITNLGTDFGKIVWLKVRKLAAVHNNNKFLAIFFNADNTDLDWEKEQLFAAERSFQAKTIELHAETEEILRKPEEMKILRKPGEMKILRKPEEMKILRKPGEMKDGFVYWCLDGYYYFFSRLFCLLMKLFHFMKWIGSMLKIRLM